MKARIRLHYAYECCIPEPRSASVPSAPTPAPRANTAEGGRVVNREDQEVREEQVPPEEPGIDRAALLRRMAVGAAALSLPGALGVEAAFGGAATSGALPSSHPKWKFAFINHVTTNPFFVPTQYGIS